MTTTPTMLDSVQAMKAVAARAGVKGRVTVYFSLLDSRPPTLQRVDRWGEPLPGRGRLPKGKKAVARRVVVGRTWLRLNAPELWAVFVAAKLVDGLAAVLPTQIPRSR